MVKRRSNSSQRTAKILISVFFALLMISSIFGVLLYGGSSGVTNTFRENGVRFTLNADPSGATYYTAKINDVNRQFLALPSQTMKFDAPAQAKSALASLPLLQTFEHAGNNSQLMDFVRANIAFELNNQGRSAGIGITESNEDYSLLSTITCADATPQTPVLFLSFGETSRITYEDDCIIATAISPQDMLLLGEYIRFVTLGIIQ